MSRLNKLPGIDTDENTTRRNVLIGGGYTILGLGTIGALSGSEEEPEEGDLGGGDDDSEPTGDDGDDSTSSGDDGDDTEPTGDDGSDDEPEPAEPTEPEYGTVSSHEFSGSGDGVESGVDVGDGLVVVDATHDGESNFVIELVGSDRDYLFVNEIGSYSGTIADIIPYDGYAVDVQADGDWSIEVTEPTVERGYDLPVDESGSGPAVIGPYEFDGVQTLTATHDGESNFIVEVFPEMGNSSLVINEIGQYDGSQAVRFDEPGWIGVQADGGWTIEVE